MSHPERCRIVSSKSSLRLMRIETCFAAVLARPNRLSRDGTATPLKNRQIVDQKGSQSNPFERLSRQIDTDGRFAAGMAAAFQASENDRWDVADASRIAGGLVHHDGRPDRVGDRGQCLSPD